MQPIRQGDVRSQTATLNHEEHKPVEIPRGDWMVRIQREYVPEEKRVSKRHEYSSDSDRNVFMTEEERVYVSKRHDSEVSNVQHEWDDSDVMWALVSD